MVVDDVFLYYLSPPLEMQEAHQPNLACLAARLMLVGLVWQAHAENWVPPGTIASPQELQLPFIDSEK